MRPPTYFIVWPSGHINIMQEEHFDTSGGVAQYAQHCAEHNPSIIVAEAGRRPVEGWPCETHETCAHRVR